MSNSEALEGGDGVVSLPQQVPASRHEQEGNTRDMPSRNKASDATSDSSEEKQAPSEVTEVSTLKSILRLPVYKLRQYTAWKMFKSEELFL
jgi:hypothetical protein